MTLSIQSTCFLFLLLFFLLKFQNTKVLIVLFLICGQNHYKLLTPEKLGECFFNSNSSLNFQTKKNKIYFLSFLDHPLSYSPLKKKSLFNWSTIDWLLWDAHFMFKNVLNIYGLFFAFFRKWVPKKWLLTPHKWTQILCWSPPNARKVHKRRKNTSPVKRYLSLCSWIRHITWIKVWQIHYKTIIKWQKARPKMTSLTTSQRHKIIQVPPIRFSCFLIDSK